jgi:UDP:flavonoid glycosyltransferase YjiC (YdhE family)
MSQKSFYLVGLVPLLFALFYLQSENLASMINNVSNLFNTRPMRSETPIIMACHPAFSHMEKITTIAQGLMALGYPVSFITGPEFKDHIERIGAKFIPIEGQGNQILSDEDLATFVSLQGADLEVFAFKSIFIKTMPAQHRTLQRTFSAFREKYGVDQKIILVSDSSFAGSAPVLLGSPGIRPDVVIGVGLAPYVGASNDTFPFRSGVYPDTSPESQQIHWEAQKAQYEDHPIDTPVNEAMRTALKEMGAKQEITSFYDALSLAPDVYLQYGIPAFEYKRSDWRPHLEFIGAPVAVGIADRELPEWWDDVLEAKKAGKHIVTVSSSSVVYDTKALIKPAMEAFGGREDVFFMATLVTSDVDTLDFKVPANARVAKFIPLDLILPYVRIFLLSYR